MPSYLILNNVLIYVNGVRSIDRVSNEYIIDIYGNVVIYGNQYVVDVRVGRVRVISTSIDRHDDRVLVSCRSSMISIGNELRVVCYE